MEVRNPHLSCHKLWQRRCCVIQALYLPEMVNPNMIHSEILKMLPNTQEFEILLSSKVSQRNQNDLLSFNCVCLPILSMYIYIHVHI